ncbi:uncharacterized protein [Haliotis cracherodii]|uniref:uncharacterized protein LOC124135825 n=1 Tax=Haliotis rufescens TaxID=6454 RepID=UPI001EB007F6|nr:uncharacterized protein LOC124135825 [Haliotis rufescens]
MAIRKIPKEVEQMFDKYVTNFTRRLKKDAALNMLEKEFSLSEEEADIIFGVFDKDQNNELSLWEFNQFYNTIGGDAHTYLAMFNDLQKDHTGLVDIERLWDVLKVMKTAQGNTLEEKDVEMFIKSTAGSEKKIDLPKFINLLCRVKLFRGGVEAH